MSLFRHLRQLTTLYPNHHMFWGLVFVNSVPLRFLLLESGQFKCYELKSGHLLYDLEKLPLKRETIILFTRAAEMYSLFGVDTEVTPL